LTWPALRRALATAALVLVSAVGAALLALRPRLWLAASASAALVLALAAIAYPPTLVYFVLLTSPFAGLLRQLEQIEVAGRTISLSGLRWLTVAIMLVTILVLRQRAIRVPKSMLPLLAFGFWAALRWLGAGADAQGAGDVLLYLLPPILAVYTGAVFRQRPGVHAHRVAWLIMGSVVIPMILYAVLFPLGELTWTDYGPKGLLGPRPVATYLVIALCVSLAWSRYSTRRSARRWALLAACLDLGVIAFTLSRMATVTSVVLVVLSRLDPRRWWRVVPRAAVGLLAATLVLIAVPQLRERLFRRVPTTIDEIAKVTSWSGRDLMWATTYEHARLRPFIGWGPGSARPLVAKVLEWEKRDVPPDEYPPHNEYLQVLHDTGLVGLSLLVIGWAGLLLHSLRNWRSAHTAGDPWLGRWWLTSSLGVFAVLVNSLADNTLHYTTVTGPLFVILGCTARLRASAVGSQQLVAAAPSEPGAAEGSRPC
jgi:O-antigen ligase